MYPIITLIYMLLLLWGSLTTKLDPQIAPFLTNWTHVPAYAGLTWLIYKAQEKRHKASLKTGLPSVARQKSQGTSHKSQGTGHKHTCVVCRVSCALSVSYGLLVACVLSISYGIAIEFLQGFTGREPSVSDALLNLAGSVGMGIFLLRPWAKDA